MYEAKSRDQWNHTASLMAAVMQPHCKQRIDPAKLNPWNKRTVDTHVTVEELQALMGFKT